MTSTIYIFMNNKHQDRLNQNSTYKSKNDIEDTFHSSKTH